MVLDHEAEVLGGRSHIAQVYVLKRLYSSRPLGGGVAPRLFHLLVLGHPESWILLIIGVQGNVRCLSLKGGSLGLVALGSGGRMSRVREVEALRTLHFSSLGS